MPKPERLETQQQATIEITTLVLQAPSKAPLDYKNYFRRKIQLSAESDNTARELLKHHHIASICFGAIKVLTMLDLWSIQPP